jgi:2-iminobutanoate/2-iminopropanoate deaminase
MSLRKIETKKAPQAIGPYSQAVAAGQFLFISGQIPINPQTGTVTAVTIEEQTTQVIDHIEAILQAAGLSLKDLVKTEIYLKDMATFPQVNAIYAARFNHPIQPARQTMQVGKLPLDVLIEISAIAYLKS